MDLTQLLNLIPATVSANPWFTLGAAVLSVWWMRRNPNPNANPGPAPTPVPPPGPLSPAPAPTPTGRPVLDLLARLLPLVAPLFAPKSVGLSAPPADLTAVPTAHLAAVRDAIRAELTSRAEVLRAEMAPELAEKLAK